LLTVAEAEAREAARSAREDIRKAIRFIQDSPTLTPSDKSRIVKQYRKLADKLEEQEEYSTQARRSLMTMGLLGVVAGFMTHESKAVVHELEKALEEIRTIAKKNPELNKRADTLAHSLHSFKGYLDYARLFVRNTRTLKEQPLSSAGQVRVVINRFKSFTDERNITIINEIGGSIMTPPMPVTVYSGLLMNLFTNSLKAVIAVESSVKSPKIVFRAWNEKAKHIIEVADNGVGIPPDLQKRIWEPLYTTTSDVANPLGSGMGLGLTLVRQVASEFGGSVDLVSPPPGFTTCFRVAFACP
jgi:signal transduction histidine kinase